MQGRVVDENVTGDFPVVLASDFQRAGSAEE